MAVPVVLKTSQGVAISNDISTENLINCFVDLRNQNEITQTPVIGWPGNTILGAVTSGSAVRGCVANQDGTEGFLVVGNTVYSTDTSGARTSLGTIGTSSGTVSMVVGTFHLMLVDGVDGYYYALTAGTLTQITDVNFLNSPTQVTYLDGYFCIIGQASSYGWVALSASDDPSTWPVTNQEHPEPILSQLLSIAAIDKELWVWGTSRLVIYQDIPGVGGSAFPFTQMYALDYGQAAPNSVATNEGTAFWLARTSNGKAKIVLAQANSVQVVGNRDIDNMIQSYSAVSDAQAYCITYAGQSFYIINFPTANQTWVYGIQTNYWFQLQTAAGNYYSFYNCYMFLNNKHTFGDSNSGRLFTLSQSQYTENGGSNIPYTVVTPVYFNGNSWLCFNLIRCYLDSSGYGSGGLTMTVSVSRDGGRTYSTSLTDLITNTRSYAQFTRLSAGKRITLKFTFSGAFFMISNIMIYAKTRGR